MFRAGTDQGYPDSKTYAAWSVMAQKWEHPVVFATVSQLSEIDESVRNIIEKNIGTYIFRAQNLICINDTCFRSIRQSTNYVKRRWMRG